MKRYQLFCPICMKKEILILPEKPETPWCGLCNRYFNIEEIESILDIDEHEKNWIGYLNMASRMKSFTLPCPICLKEDVLIEPEDPKQPICCNCDEKINLATVQKNLPKLKSMAKNWAVFFADLRKLQEMEKKGGQTDNE